MTPPPLPEMPPILVPWQQQLIAAWGRAVRAAALEEAAKVCEDSPGDRLPYGCAAAIRALKEGR